MMRCGFSPGKRSMGWSIGIRRSPRTNISRSLAKYSGTTGIFSRWMYSQTSSSVQLEKGKNAQSLPGSHCEHCRDSRIPGAGSWGPIGRGNHGQKRLFPWRAIFLRRGALHRWPHRFRWPARHPVGPWSSTDRSICWCPAGRDWRRFLQLPYWCGRLTASQFATKLVAKLDHLAEFESGIDVQQRKRNFPRIKCLLSQPKHYGRIFADGVQHCRVGRFRNNFSYDVYAFCFKSSRGVTSISYPFHSD